MNDHVLSVSPCDACQEHARAARAEPEWRWGRCTTPTEANANVLAAAHDMLAALRAIADDPDNAPLVLSDSHSWTLIDQARAAVAKATGQPSTTEAA